MILKYEVKKIFFNRGTLVALLMLLSFVVFNIIYTIQLEEWVLEDNSTINGIEAIKIAKEEKSKYNGIITEDVVSNIIEQYQDISNHSKDGSLPDKGWIEVQPINDLVKLVNCSFGEFQEYNYFTCGLLSTSQSSHFYQNRIDQVKRWANSNNGDALKYNKVEKDYFIKSAETLDIPFTYSYMDGWKAVLKGVAVVLFCVMLVLCIIIAPIFSSEYQSGMDAILFSSKYGKTKVASTKTVAAYIVTTVVYWSTTLLYSLSVLIAYGFDGANSIIQTNMACWKSFYHFTNVQALLVILGLGYQGSLFMISLTMLASAKAKTTFEAIVIPLVILLIPMMIDSTYMPKVVIDIMNLLPNNAAEGIGIFQEYNVFQVGGKVLTQCQMILIIYVICILLLNPIILFSYRKHKIK